MPRSSDAPRPELPPGQLIQTPGEDGLRAHIASREDSGVRIHRKPPDDEVPSAS